jgi:hypothetical protein
MGMGLSIARTIVEAHGGHIVAENQASGGTVFRVTLPLTKSHSNGTDGEINREAEAAEVAQRPTMFPGGKGRIGHLARMDRQIIFKCRRPALAPQ